MDEPYIDKGDKPEICTRCRFHDFNCVISERLDQNAERCSLFVAHRHEGRSPMSQIGRLFRNARREASLTPKEVALAAGYKNLNKGLRRLNSLEGGQTMLHDPRIVEKFAAALSIDEADIAVASAHDWQELNRPIRPYLAERLMPAVYRRHRLPEDCTVEEARSMAAKMSVETGRSFCLVLSRVRAVYFYANGEVCESRYAPGMSIGRHNAFMAMSKRASKVPLIRPAD